MNEKTEKRQRRQRMNRSDFPMLNGTTKNVPPVGPQLHVVAPPRHSRSAKAVAWLVLGGILTLGSVGAATTCSYFVRQVVKNLVAESCLKK